MVQPRLLLCAIGLWLCSACSDDASQTCRATQDCPAGYECVANQCYPATDTAGDVQQDDTAAPETAADLTDLDIVAEDTLQPDTAVQDTADQAVELVEDTPADDTLPETGDLGEDTEDTEPADEGVEDIDEDTADAVDAVDAGPCVNDDFDLDSPNDTVDTATILTDKQADHDGLKICGSEEDWYRLSADELDHIYVAFEHQAGGQTLFVELIGPNQTTKIAQSDSSQSPPGFHVGPIGESGDYYLRVRAEGGDSDDVTYFLSFYIVGTLCSDGYEDNDSVADAVHLSTGLYEDLLMCPLDEDWYQVAVTAGTLVKVAIAYKKDPTNIGLQLIDSDQTTVVLEDVAPDITPEQIRELTTPEAAENQEFYVRIFRHQPPATTHVMDYVLSISSQ